MIFRQAKPQEELYSVNLNLIPPSEPAHVIVDTDMLTDCDDAGAIAVLHALADLGQVEILGIALNGIDTHQKHSAVVSAINTYFGRETIPIGHSKRTMGQTPSKPSVFSKEIFAEYPHDGLKDPDRQDAVSMYKEILSAAPNQSITIISIGFLSNLKDLLTSKQGKELIGSKVRTITIMGGNYPSGQEYNFCFGNTAKDTRYVMENWPQSVPMNFIGFELGQRILTGTAYKSTPNSPMRRAYELAYNAINQGRPSWDPIAVLFGVLGNTFNGKTYFSLIKGRNQIDTEGGNKWFVDNSSRHAYLEAAAPIEEIAEILEKLMTHTPQGLKLQA